MFPPSNSAASPCKTSPCGVPKKRRFHGHPSPGGQHQVRRGPMASQLSPPQSLEPARRPCGSPKKMRPGGGRGRQDQIQRLLPGRAVRPASSTAGRWRAPRRAAPRSPAINGRPAASPVFPEKTPRAEDGATRPDQRVADMLGWLAPRARKKGLFKGKDAQQAPHVRRIVRRRPFRHAHACGATR